jgi:hypothetical protein
MTQEQIDFIITITNHHLSTFLNIKETKFDNLWTNDCKRLFLEIKMGTIHMAENYLLQPVRTFDPPKLTFAADNEPYRVEIANMVNEIFKNWKQQN